MNQGFWQTKNNFRKVLFKRLKKKDIEVQESDQKYNYETSEYFTLCLRNNLEIHEMKREYTKKGNKDSQKRPPSEPRVPLYRLSNGTI